MSPKKKTKSVKKKTRPAGRKKTARKKPAAKKTAGKKLASPQGQGTVAAPSLEVAGEVTHFFPHVLAGVIKLACELKVGDMVQIKGHTTDFKQTVDSMQVDHVPVKEARKGQEIGLKVRDRVRIGDVVYKL